jgi:hypothetical protein
MPEGLFLYILKILKLLGYVGRDNQLSFLNSNLSFFLLLQNSTYTTIRKCSIKFVITQKLGEPCTIDESLHYSYTTHTHLATFTSSRQQINEKHRYNDRLFFTRWDCTHVSINTTIPHHVH